MLEFEHPVVKAVGSLSGDGYVIETKGKTTKATLIISGISGKGRATCFTEDKYSKDIGEGIALSRALKDVAQQMENLWCSRVVTEDEYSERHPNKSE